MADSKGRIRAEGDGVWIVCGGTGGHLAPGIATAQRLLDAAVEVRLVVSRKEVDQRLLSLYPEIPSVAVIGYPLVFAPMGLLKCVFGNAWGIVRAWLHLRRRPPAVLLAFGGYISVNYVLASRMLNIPVVLHEANRMTGRSIRLLSGMADMNFVPEGTQLRGIEPKRMQTMRMPLRKEVQHIRKETIREQMGLPLHSKLLLVVGGSQGAKVLNDWVKLHWPQLAANRISVILVTGPGKVGDLNDQTEELADGSCVELRIFAFADAMHELYSAADLVLSRAGAGTIAELSECLTPSILVPYPHAADDHQNENAREHERRGACVVLPQTQMGQLYDEVFDLLYSDWMLDRMRRNLKRLAFSHAAEHLAAFLMREYLEGGGGGNGTAQ